MSEDLWPEEIRVTKVKCDCGCEYFNETFTDITYGTCALVPGKLIRLSVPRSRVVRCIECDKEYSI